MQCQPGVLGQSIGLIRAYLIEQRALFDLNRKRLELGDNPIGLLVSHASQDIGALAHFGLFELRGELIYPSLFGSFSLQGGELGFILVPLSYCGLVYFHALGLFGFWLRPRLIGNRREQLCQELLPQTSGNLNGISHLIFLPCIWFYGIQRRSLAQMRCMQKRVSND